MSKRAPKSRHSKSKHGSKHASKSKHKSKPASKTKHKSKQKSKHSSKSKLKSKPTAKSKRLLKSKPAAKRVAKSKPAPKPAFKVKSISPKPVAKTKPAVVATPTPPPVTLAAPAPVAPAPAPVSLPLSALPADSAAKVCLTTLKFTPAGFLPCDGSVVTITAAPTVFALLGKKYGGDGKTTFGLPNLSGLTPDPASGNYHFVLPLDPKYPTLTSTDFSQTDTLGFIRQFKGATLPQGYLYCDGSLQQITSECAFFALIGTTFGGDGLKTFAVPDLRPLEKNLSGARYIIAEAGYFPEHQ